MGSVNGAKTARFKPRLYTVDFPEGHDYHGLVARFKGASVDALLRLLEVADQAADVAEGSAATITPGHREAVEVMITEFAGLLHWWNVDTEDDEERLVPVPPTVDGVRSQDFAMVMALFGRWMDTVTLVARPLPNGSPGGPSPGELASIPMAPPQPSPPS